MPVISCARCIKSAFVRGEQRNCRQRNYRAFHHASKEMERKHAKGWIKSVTGTIITIVHCDRVAPVQDVLHTNNQEKKNQCS